MNKGTYGFGLPPNFATRVAPPKWNNFQPYTAPGTYSFTVPQNVYQVYGIAVGGGGDGTSVYTTVPASTNMVFPALTASLSVTQTVSYASNQFDGQLCFYNNLIYFVGNSAIYSTQFLGAATSSVRSTATSGGGIIAANGSLMIAVPNDGLITDTIYYTNNGTTWTASTVVSNAQPLIYSWGASNSNFVVAYQNTATTQYTTNSAVSFSTSTVTFSGSIKGLAYGAGVFVAVGGGTTVVNSGISSSPTGATWTARTSVLALGQSFNCVRFLNNQFIAVASDGTINTSPDGITWTNRASGTSQVLNDITYDSTIGLYLISGTNNTSNQYLTSPDGITWTVRSLGVSLNNNASTGLYCNSLNGCFVITLKTYSSGAGGVCTSIDGINWKLAASGVTSYTPCITGGRMYIPVGSSNIRIGCSYTMPGGGGGGFASGIVDVIPGQTLTVTVGATAGSSSIGTNITATGGSSNGAAGVGVVTPTLRGISTANGGVGGAGALTDTTFTSSASWKVGGGGGGACGWTGVAGGAGGATTGTGGGGGGGILLGSGGTAPSNYGGGGGGAGFAGGIASSNSVGGGGTNSSTTTTTGGNGFSCLGGALGANGGTPTTIVSLSYVQSLLAGAFEGAGGGGGGSTVAGGNGSGIGGGGGGGGASTTAAFLAGNGSIGGGGGGGGSPSNSGPSVGAGSSVCFGGGGGQGVLATQATHQLTGYGGSSAVGGGGGAHSASQTGTQASLGVAAGANVPGSKVNGAAGAGGVGYVALLWTEGY